MKIRTSKGFAFFAFLFAAVAIAAAQQPQAPAAPPPDARFKADILMIVAHPDDETEITAYLARAIYDEHKRVAIAYCTCGGAGGDTVSYAQGRACATNARLRHGTLPHPWE